MSSISNSSRFILISTGQFIGEGFDNNRLSSLVLASPIKFEGKLVQYIGRIGRDEKITSEIEIFDFVDVNSKIFRSMYNSRKKTYQKLNFEITELLD